MQDQYEIKCYKIWYEDAPDDFYIGSTKLSLSRRMVEHRMSVKKGRDSLIYRTMREKGVKVFKYCLLGSCTVSNSDEQRMFEQSYIDSMQPTLNSHRAYISVEGQKQHNIEYRKKAVVHITKKNKEYYAKNKQKMNQQKKGYYQKNAEQSKQQMKEYYHRSKDIRLCVCGGKYNYGHKSQRLTHYNSQQHTDFVVNFRKRLVEMMS